jgi:hypothetical protein
MLIASRLKLHDITTPDDGGGLISVMVYLR